MSSMKHQNIMTSAEPNDGLTTPSAPSSRAEEQSFASTDVKDATRRWLTSRVCTGYLDQFFHSNMTCFLNQWLQDTEKYDDDDDDDDAINEEVINLSLQALENFPLCHGKFNFSEVMVIVREMFGHKLVQIKQRMHAFFERWADRSFDCSATQIAVRGECCNVELSYDENNAAREANILLLDYTHEGLNGYGALAASTLNEQEKPPPPDDHIDIEPNGGEGVSYEPSEPNLKVLEYGENVGKRLLDLSSTSNRLDENEAPALEPSQEIGVAWEVAADYAGRDCNSFPELASGELFSSERLEKGKFLLDLNFYPDSEVLDCDLSLPPSNPLNLSAPVTISASNGVNEHHLFPINLECEISSRNSTAENKLFGVTLFEEEEKALTLPELSSSTQPSIKNFDLYDEPSSFLESRMITDRSDESSTLASIMAMEQSTASSSHWAPNLDLTLNSGLKENGGNEEGNPVRPFMAERRNLLGEERKNSKRKEPDSDWEPPRFGYSPLRLKL